MGEERGSSPRPLVAYPSSSDDEDASAPTYPHKTRHTKCAKYCCRITICMLIISVVLTVILSFTVFRIEDPILKINVVKVTELELMYTTIPMPGANMSLFADVSVRNPNVLLLFTYGNTTTTLYYHGIVVGEARGPAGRAGPWRTVRMNVTVDVSTDRLISYQNVNKDVRSGLLTMSSYSRIPSGRVEVFKVFKKRVNILSMNCSITFNISSQAIEEQICKS
ncbi:late embryogenesis abundant protein At1g64065-like [Corylus avellana]|uniref:late embryogenesis abundant protein At1g64065-like n=1 Tax=Corylus avellana TaxID=13451 RepID=UPI00286AC426|nr:late embryogenesis abundant protein At1g64065-like [Corylus avellana]